MERFTRFDRERGRGVPQSVCVESRQASGLRVLPNEVVDRRHREPLVFVIGLPAQEERTASSALGPALKVAAKEPDPIP